MSQFRAWRMGGGWLACWHTAANTREPGKAIKAVPLKKATQEGSPNGEDEEYGEGESQGGQRTHQSY